MSGKEELFAELYSQSQQRLLGYVVGLVRNTADAQDILQQTAITAWRKFDDFKQNTDFIRWVITIARYETLNFLRSKRSNKVCFNQSLMQQLEENVCEFSSDAVEEQSEALSMCLKKLSSSDHKMVQCRYTYGLGTSQIAKVLDRSPSSVCNSLKRIRDGLLRCIQRRLAEEMRDV